MPAGKGKEVMIVRILGRCFGLLLLLAALVPLCVLSAAAAETTVSGYSQEDDTVTISVTAGTGIGSDFVTEFPAIDTQNMIRTRTFGPELADQPRKEYVSIPLYYQTDYPNSMYGDGTVASGGCSITSMAMVASYLTGYEYWPDELAYYFGGRANNNIARLEYASKALGLDYEKPENWHYTLQELQQGKIAIILVGENSPFTESQHFLVLTGLTEEGKILVNDPYAPNYSKWDLKEGFLTGFDESQIVAGYQGAWVYDKAAVPEEIDRYVEQTANVGTSRYDVELTLAERQLLARVIWAAARGESLEGQQAVAEVVLNRLMSDNFPDTLRDVIYGENQFRSVDKLEDAEPSQAQYQALEKALYGPNILPMDVVYFATYPTNDKEWGTIGNHIFCYENDKVFEDAMG